MGLILGVDVETTGLDAEKDIITELGYMLYDMELGKPLVIGNDLLIPPGDVVITKEITEITGITLDMLENYGQERRTVMQEFCNWLDLLPVLVAHNAPFDRGFLVEEMQKSENDVETRHIEYVADPTNWIDTSVDVPYKTSTRKLVHLCAEHGFVNPFAHRAIFDVISMVKVMENYSYDEILRRSDEPDLLVVAECRPPWEDGGKSTGIAKANGFRWDGSRKVWSRIAKESDLKSLKDKLDFTLEATND